MELNKKISKILKDKKIKVCYLAKEIGISQGGLYDLLRGDASNPTIKTVVKIADALELSDEELGKLIR